MPVLIHSDPTKPELSLHAVTVILTDQERRLSQLEQQLRDSAQQFDSFWQQYKALETRLAKIEKELTNG